MSSVYFSERNRRNNYAEEGSLVDATAEVEAMS